MIEFLAGVEASLPIEQQKRVANGPIAGSIQLDQRAAPKALPAALTIKALRRRFEARRRQGLRVLLRTQLPLPRAPRALPLSFLPMKNLPRLKMSKNLEPKPGFWREAIDVRCRLLRGDSQTPNLARAARIRRHVGCATASADTYQCYVLCPTFPNTPAVIASGDSALKLQRDGSSRCLNISRVSSSRSSWSGQPNTGIGPFDSVPPP